jgi:ParB-like chromosome segregation protein Spo0J
MKLETLQLNKLNPAEYNPRTITKDEFEGLKTSLQTFGQQENLIVNKDMTIISGHQRYNAMKALGWTEAVCNLVNLDKHEEKKLNVIMNSTAISGKYDQLKLDEILEELKLDDNYNSLRLNELEPLDLSTGNDDDLELKNAFEVVLEVENEIEQQEAFEKLTEMGYKCRVLTL